MSFHIRVRKTVNCRVSTWKQIYAGLKNNRRSVCIAAGGIYGTAAREDL